MDEILGQQHQPDENGAFGKYYFGGSASECSHGSGAEIFCSLGTSGSARIAAFESRSQEAISCGYHCAFKHPTDLVRSWSKEDWHRLVAL